MNTNWPEFIKLRTLACPNFRQRLTATTNHPRYFINKKQQLLNFISNDYLGLSLKPELIMALQHASYNYGVGSTGSAYLSGYSKEHDYLAQEIAQWLGYAKCLLFNSGYQLNISLFKALVDQHLLIWIDKRCHASHFDGVLLAKTCFNTFTDQNLADTLDQIVSQKNKRHLIISEGTFSMDGTCNYWPQLLALKAAYPDNILLIIDDAHGIGALGNLGYGTLEQLGLAIEGVDLFIGTFGKAFGTHAAFICGDENLIYYLQHSVRSQIFSTNFPPCIAASTRASLALIQSAHGDYLRQQLKTNINYFINLATELKLNLYQLAINQSPIQLLIFPNISALSATYNVLIANNILAAKIIYPTVPYNKPRLRISLRATHHKSDIQHLVTILQHTYQTIV